MFFFFFYSHSVAFRKESSSGSRRGDFELHLPSNTHLDLVLNQSPLHIPIGGHPSPNLASRLISPLCWCCYSIQIFQDAFAVVMNSHNLPSQTCYFFLPSFLPTLPPFSPCFRNLLHLKLGTATEWPWWKCLTSLNFGFLSFWFLVLTAACRPLLPVVEVWIFNHWTTREFPQFSYL